MTQAGDEQLTCAQFMEQIGANRKEFAQMQRQYTEVGRANAANSHFSQYSYFLCDKGEELGWGWFC